jgi:hypothetical protein
MIYAPPSREKSKQTVRSPLLEKGKSNSIGNQLVADEYSQPMMGSYPVQHASGTAGGQRKKQAVAPSTMVMGGAGASFKNQPASRQ